MNIAIKVSALVEKGGQLLLIKEKIDERGYKWNVVKGTFDPEKDADLEAALQRELKEEAGIIECRIVGINKTFVFRRSDSITVQINYLVETDQEIDLSKNKAEPDESIDGFQLFSKEEISQLNPEDFLTDRAYILTRNWIKIES